MKETEKIWAALDVLIELNIPFVSRTATATAGTTVFMSNVQIFSHASPFAVVPPEVTEKISSCGFGYSSSWIPQTDVLGHKVCLYL